MTKFNPYEVLGLTPDCSAKDIKKAFHKLSKKYHPDICNDAQKFIEINEAVQLLRDPYRRSLFDEFGICVDFSENTVTKMVDEKFRSIVEAWIDHQIRSGSLLPIKSFFDESIRNARINSQKNMEHTKELIINLKLRVGHVTVDSGVNIVHELLNARIQTLTDNLTRMEQENYIIGLIEKECSKYSSTDMNDMANSGSMSYSINYRFA